MKKIALFGLILTLITSFNSHHTAFAESSSTLGVSPMYQKIILMPGEQYHGSIKISNPNDATSAVAYNVNIAPFSQYATTESKDDYGEISLSEISDYNQIVNWITLSNNTGIASPNETISIPFVINTPYDAPAGGQYATLVVTNTSEDETKSQGNMQIASTIQIASIIYAEVAGETRREGAILENNMPSFITSSPLEATSMVKNNGNVHTDAEYILQVWPMFSNEEICTNEENATTSLVMPETEKFHTESCDLPSIGIFRARQTVKIFGEESITEKTIFICPIWLLFAGIFVIIILIMWVFLIFRKRKSTRK